MNRLTNSDKVRGVLKAPSRNLIWNLLRNPVEPHLALHQSLPDLLRNLLRNRIELDLALQQSLPGLLRNLLRNLPESSGILLNLTWLCTKASQAFCGTFYGTLLNLTWLCTKASQTFSGTSGTFSGTSLNLTRGACTSAHRSYSGLTTPLA